MAETKISCFWKKPEFAGEYQAAVSLHSHTNHSKESLHFIPKIARKWFLLHWAFESQRKKTSIPVDFVRAYWTPPLTPKLAFEVERNQIETVLGLTGFVSLTDHDNIEAPTLLRVLPESRRTPFALEWSVPFEGAVFHLGVHNLPSSRAQEIVADLVRWPDDGPARTFWKGCQEYLFEEPESNWDGVYYSLTLFFAVLFVVSQFALRAETLATF